MLTLNTEHTNQTNKQTNSYLETVSSTTDKPVALQVSPANWRHFPDQTGIGIVGVLIVGELVSNPDYISARLVISLLPHPSLWNYSDTWWWFIEWVTVSTFEQLRTAVQNHDSRVVEETTNSLGRPLWKWVGLLTSYKTFDYS